MPAAQRPVDLKIGGRNFRVVSSAAPEALQQLGSLVEIKLRELGGVQTSHPQAFLLVALALANDLVEERAARTSEKGEVDTLRRRSADSVREMLVRVDQALEHVDEHGAPLGA
ncbi:MAG: hypothetical protein RJA70_36 [Pseudomonadota bacterium]|jgi:cell division protein ZapA (FtsZ GTPase activity inhibitor)